MMPVPVIIVAGAAVLAGISGLVSWWKSRGKKKDEPKTQPLPPDVAQAVAHLREKMATAAEVGLAADLADKAGHVKLGAALRSEAGVLEVAEKFAEEMHKQQAPVVFQSPLDGVTDEAWTKFVKRSRSARPSTVSAKYQLGMFAMTARDLADAGFMTTAQKQDEDGHSVWMGEWAPGKSLDEFIASPQQQYDAFMALTKLHATVIGKQKVSIIGEEIEGQKATLSGLLAVAKKAGLGGLASWVKSAKERSTFKDTTERYQQLNGIF